MIYSGKTNVGKVRLTNQDSFAIKSYASDVIVAVVCDGMGGARGGNIASETAIEYFMKSFEGEELADLNKNPYIDATKAMSLLGHAVYNANEAVYNKAISSPELMGMGTTLVACLIIKDHMYVANVGDSRLYIDSGKKLSQITEDHSYVQFLVDVGDITPEEAKTHPYKNRITRAVGIQPDIDCDMFGVELDKYPDASVLLCSDGLCGQVEDTMMHKIIKAPGSKKDSEQTKLDCRVDKLIDAALENGGPDNITVILLLPNQA
jgi:protein phosphatase